MTVAKKLGPKKYLAFKQCNDGHYIILTQNKQVLGTINPRGVSFPKRVVFTECEPDTEWTSECLEQLAEFIKTIEPKKSF